ncbi:hypothetical protein CR203_07070 [Salipaludibacillus neizhouensis]|uniref:Uncharacterized protein n=1 Tax=Salipaludibacillus neizhouensis TaxID=885475 RepID=A0A3A9K7N7_9BACI|nr:hypothetical protein [Salipaludibacillus neizhouensis]RKL68239.1 hypothetical protein CR203_07070 [Salipaludibacillus neizhouensis]
MQFLRKGHYKDLEQAAIDVLKRLSQFIDINTVFIAKNDKETVEITHSFNRDYMIIEEGFETKYSESY